MTENKPVKVQSAPPFYFRRDGNAFIPSRFTRNPWMTDAIAGGPVAALIGEIIDSAGFDPAFEISRTTLDIFGKVPSVPLHTRITALRAGKQLQDFDAQRLEQQPRLLQGIQAHVRRHPCRVAVSAAVSANGASASARRAHSVSG